MDRQSCIACPEGAILYNVRTYVIAKTTSSYRRIPVPADQEVLLHLEKIIIPSSVGGDFVGSCEALPPDEWEFVDDRAPSNVRIALLEARLEELEQFAYSRLR